MIDSPSRPPRFDLSRSPRLLRYGIALALAGTAAAGTLLLTRPLAHTAFLLFYAAVLLTGWIAGRGPALGCVALALVTVDRAYLAAEPWPLQVAVLAAGAALLATGAVLVDRVARSSRERQRALEEQATRLLALAEEADARRREAEAARDRARFLGRVARTLSATLDSTQALRALARLIVDGMADYSVTYLLEEGGVIRRVGVAHADAEQEALVARLGELAPYTLDSPHGAGVVIRTGEPVLAPEVTSEMLAAASNSPEHLRVLERLGPRSSLVVPLAARGRVVGAIAVAATDRSGRRYDEQDLELALELAAQAAPVVDNARLYRAVEERRQILAEAGRLFTSSLDLRTTLDNVARLVVDRLADFFVIDLLDEAGSRLERVEVGVRDPAHQSLVEESRRRFPPTLGNPSHPISRAVLDGEPTLVGEVESTFLSTAARGPEHREFLDRMGLLSLMVVPLTGRGGVRGAMSFVTLRGGRIYGEDDLELARQLATQAALALDNARLYGESERAVALRDEILAIVAHDLRNPLQVISGMAQVLAVAPAGERPTFLGRIEQAVGRAERLIQDLLDVSRIEAGRLSIHREEVALSELLLEACGTIEAAAAAKGIRLERSLAPGTVDADRERLVQALCNLLENALAHTPSGGTVRVAAEPLDGRVRFSVEDTGPGIDEHHLPHLFDRFWQADKGRRGTGLGLAIVKGIVEAHGGEVRVASRPGRGSTFAFEVPSGRAAAVRRSEAAGGG